MENFFNVHHFLNRSINRSTDLFLGVLSNFAKLNSKMLKNIFLKEVRSKILILLETTGGISFLLEGFEKSYICKLKLDAE